MGKCLQLTGVIPEIEEYQNGGYVHAVKVQQP